MASVSWLQEALQNVSFMRSHSSVLSFVVHKLRRCIFIFASSLLVSEYLNPDTDCRCTVIREAGFEVQYVAGQSESVDRAEAYLMILQRRLYYHSRTGNVSVFC